MKDPAGLSLIATLSPDEVNGLAYKWLAPSEPLQGPAPLLLLLHGAGSNDDSPHDADGEKQSDRTLAALRDAHGESPPKVLRAYARTIAGRLRICQGCATIPDGGGRSRARTQMRRGSVRRITDSCLVPIRRDGEAAARGGRILELRRGSTGSARHTGQAVKRKRGDPA